MSPCHRPRPGDRCDGSRTTRRGTRYRNEGGNILASRNGIRVEPLPAAHEQPIRLQRRLSRLSAPLTHCQTLVSPNLRGPSAYSVGAKALLCEARVVCSFVLGEHVIPVAPNAQVWGIRNPQSFSIHVPGADGHLAGTLPMTQEGAALRARASENFGHRGTSLSRMGRTCRSGVVPLSVEICSAGIAG
jgi:hypothetical protein